MARDPCPFCARIAARDFDTSNDHAVAFADGHPVSQGHSLVVPRTHCEDLFSLPATALDEVWRLVAEVRTSTAALHHPDGFNVGVNAGAAAGQTVPHAHVHVIPRFDGDVDDPRGGIRWVLPEHARYWER